MAEGISLGKGCRMLHSTGTAVRVETPDHGVVWVPESCVHDDSELHAATPPETLGELVVWAWFAYKQGWV